MNVVQLIERLVDNWLPNKHHSIYERDGIDESEGGGNKRRIGLISKPRAPQLPQSLHETYTSSKISKTHKDEENARRRGEKLYMEEETTFEKPSDVYDIADIKPFPELSKELKPFESQFKPLVVQKIASPAEKVRLEKRPMEFYVPKSKRLVYRIPDDPNDVPYPKPLRFTDIILERLNAYAMAMCYESKTQQDTFHLAVQIFGMFLIKTTIVYELKDVQFIMTVCVFIADKFVSGYDVFPNGFNIDRVKQYSMTHITKHIVAMESTILREIDYIISPPIYQTYFDKILGWNILNQRDIAFSHCFLDIASIIGNIHFEFRPSLVVVGCVILALKTIHSKTHVLGRINSIVDNSGYEMHEVNNMVTHLIASTTYVLNSPSLNRDYKLKYTKFVLQTQDDTEDSRTERVTPRHIYEIYTRVNERYNSVKSVQQLYTRAIN
jgi:hypothetical protein